MALVKCEDCGREVSDRAPACPNCGAPTAVGEPQVAAPDGVSIDGEDFVGARSQVMALAMKAIQSINYKVDAADESTGLISFTTGMTMGSWSGVSGSIYFEEVQPHRFKASGSAKQNVKGGQVFALDLFGESKSKVLKIISEMQRLAK